LFDRLSARHGGAITRMLTVQYRMHEAIMEWPSRELYDGRLEAHPSVARHLLSGLPGVAASPDTIAPLVFIDTAGCGFEEAVEPEGDSKRNDGEAAVVARHLESLFAAGLSPADAAVITPYNAQVDRLRAALAPAHPGLEIGSVDGFQGREKEAVVISLVRSNHRGDVGFLSDDRRTNVAVTRARRHLAVIGDSATISRHAFLGRLVEHCQARGEYRSAWEYR
ncbi:MAG: AAA family ATPase, partial [Planctomycetes bacterium]|nr:AAA family ATPase [Planctomycetota bacterium]